jgi:hypothetical protein
MNGLHIDRGTVYESDFATLKKYREDYYRITLHRQIRRAGYEAIDGEEKHRSGKKNTAGNEGKLEESLSRTKSKIFELALCNDWQWFVTLTLNAEYHDRKDLKSYKIKLSTWIKNYNRLHKTNIKYLLMPENHKDGSWHMHGLMIGLPKEHLREFTEQERLPIKILIELKRGHKVYTWEAYGKAFGYITMSEIRHIESVSKYITKYITKDIAKTRIGLNEHLYYCSQGLKRAEIIYQGKLIKEIEEDYSNDYVKIKTVRDTAEAQAYFIMQEEGAAQTGAEEALME